MSVKPFRRDETVIFELLVPRAVDGAA